MFDIAKTCRCCLVEVEDENELFEFSSEFGVSDVGSNTSPNATPSFFQIHTCYKKLVSSLSSQESATSKICTVCLQELRAAFVFHQKSVKNCAIYKRKAATARAGRFGVVVNEVKKEPDDLIEEDVVEDLDPRSGNLKTEYVEYDQVEYLEPNDYLGMDYEEEDEEDERSHDDKYQLKPMLKMRTPRKTKRDLEELNESVLYCCGFCPKTFEKKDYYRRHFRRLHIDEQIEIETALLLEQNREDEVKDLQMYQCEHCGQIEVIKTKHMEHKLSHHSENLYKCKHCEEKFPTREILKEHVANHGEIKRAFMCDICGSDFRNKHALNTHCRRHTGERPFQCEVCAKKFAHNNTLKIHMETHNEDRATFACEVCGQFCQTKASLKNHIICFHKTELKIKCPSCDKSFVDKSKLKMHQAYHIGDKKFTCTLCGQKYYKTSHLKRHVQHVHMKLRLWKCEYCTSDFVRKETYRTHILNHHKGLSAAEMEMIMEKIKNFREPDLDIDAFTLEKQKNFTVMDKTENIQYEIEEMVE